METLKQKFLSHFTAEELKSIAQNVIVFFSTVVVVADSLPQVNTFLNGEWSWVGLVVVLGAIARSGVKIAWTMTVLWAKSKNFLTPKQ